MEHSQKNNLQNFQERSNSTLRRGGKENKVKVTSLLLPNVSLINTCREIKKKID